MENRWTFRDRLDYVANLNDLKQRLISHQSYTSLVGQQGALLMTVTPALRPQ